MTNLHKSLYDKPITALQTYLRALSYVYKLNHIVPDGIFGVHTQTCVKQFQTLIGMTPTGVVDYDTWSELVSHYTRLYSCIKPPDTTILFPSATYVVKKGCTNHVVPIIQTMLRALSLQFEDFPSVEISEIYDDSCIACVSCFQAVCTLPITGEVDRATWDAITHAYHAFIDVFYDIVL